MQKKAQSGINAAVLVAIIAGLIVIYILFMPVSERKEILDINDSEEDGGGEEDENVLLLENPGRLEFIEKKEIEKPIDSLNLYTKTEAVVLKEINSIYVKNGIFDKLDKSFSFKVKDLEITDNILLTFIAKTHKGRLVISINGYEIYNDEINTLNIEPIKIPVESLKEDNVVDISVSGVGIAFWKTNEYSLEGIKITSEYTDKSGRESMNIFLVTESEEENIKEIEIRFSPECSPAKVGVLDVLINNRNIYSAIPDCGSLVMREFSPFYVVPGENTVIFRAESGRYLLDQIKITAKLKETPSYIYYFEMSNDQIKSIEEDKKDANLTLDFVDDIEVKEAEIVINGRRIYLSRTQDESYSRNINNYVKEGTNSLKIIPKRALDVREIRVELAEA